jgi:predicted GNAT family acetyltransferase
MDGSETPVVDNKAEQRYELWQDGHMAFVTYDLEEGAIAFLHTVVPPELGGKGVGTRLARAVLADARARGLKVIPHCPFVTAFIRRHQAEYLPLVAPEHRGRITSEAG